MYKVTTDEQSEPQVNALPEEALGPFAEARVALELAPWNGAPYHRDRPDGIMRAMHFGPHGEGDIVYMILEDQRQVDILVVLWFG